MKVNILCLDCKKSFSLDVIEDGPFTADCPNCGTIIRHAGRNNKETKMKDKLPVTVYIYSDDDEDLDVDERTWEVALLLGDLASRGGGNAGPIGIYELKSQGEVKTSVKFVKDTKKKKK